MSRTSKRIPTKVEQVAREIEAPKKRIVEQPKPEPVPEVPIPAANRLGVPFDPASSSASYMTYCPTCNGGGEVAYALYTAKCPTCGGRGLVNA